MSEIIQLTQGNVNALLIACQIGNGNQVEGVTIAICAQYGITVEQIDEVRIIGDERVIILK